MKPTYDSFGKIVVDRVGNYQKHPMFLDYQRYKDIFEQIREDEAKGIKFNLDHYMRYCLDSDEEDNDFDPKKHSKDLRKPSKKTEDEEQNSISRNSLVMDKVTLMKAIIK